MQNVDYASSDENRQQSANFERFSYIRKQLFDEVTPILRHMYTDSIKWIIFQFIISNIISIALGGTGSG